MTRQATVAVFDPDTSSGLVLLDDGTPVPFDAGAFVGSGFRLLRAGQRVAAELADDGSRVRALRLPYP